MIACRRMSAAERPDVFALLASERADHVALGKALTLFVEREDFGFVWVAFADDESIVACVLVSYAISTEAGGLVAALDDILVSPGARRTGIGTGLLETLATHLRAMDIVGMRASVPRASGLQRFFSACGFAVRDDEGYVRGIDP